MQCLVSVNQVEEALLVVNAGVPMVDIKDTAYGALAALDLASTQAIVMQVRAHARAQPVLLSATVGDDWVSLQHLHTAVTARLALGIDVIKLSETLWRAQAASHQLADWCKQGVKLIAVYSPDSLHAETTIRHSVQHLAAQGFYGVMVDTINKAQPLCQLVSESQLAHFIQQAQQHGLRVGLAGGMQLNDLERVMRLAPDYVGFRGGLCVAGQRQSRLLPDAVQQLVERLPTCSVALSQNAAHQRLLA